MKLATGLLSAITLLSSTSQLFAYATSFETVEGYSTISTANIGGQQGWLINDAPGPAPAADQLSFFQIYNGGSDVWGALGGFNSTPDTTPNVELSHSAVLPLVGVSFATDMAITSNTIGTYDKFGWSFKNGASDLLRIAFEPDPLNNAKLEVVWYDSAGGAHPLGNGIVRDAIYNLSFSVTGSGADAAFTAAITPSVGAPLNFGGTLTGQAGASLTGFAADFDTTAPYNPNPPLTPVPQGHYNGAGSAYMAFNNLSIVPEPSSTLSLGLVALGMLARRKRSA